MAYTDKKRFLKPITGRIMVAPFSAARVDPALLAEVDFQLSADSGWWSLGLVTNAGTKWAINETQERVQPWSSRGRSTPSGVGQAVFELEATEQTHNLTALQNCVPPDPDGFSVINIRNFSREPVWLYVEEIYAGGLMRRRLGLAYAVVREGRSTRGDIDAFKVTFTFVKDPILGGHFAQQLLALEEESMIWRGDWDPTKTYAVNDAVTYNGSSWRRLVKGTTPGNPEEDSTNWYYIAKKGDDASANFNGWAWTPGTYPAGVTKTYGDAYVGTNKLTSDEPLITGQPPEAEQDAFEWDFEGDTAVEDDMVKLLPAARTQFGGLVSKLIPVPLGSGSSMTFEKTVEAGLSSWYLGLLQPDALRGGIPSSGFNGAAGFYGVALDVSPGALYAAQSGSLSSPISVNKLNFIDTGGVDPSPTWTVDFTVDGQYLTISLRGYSQTVFFGSTPLNEFRIAFAANGSTGEFSFNSPITLDFNDTPSYQSPDWDVLVGSL